jgi:hypothetical protein
MKISISGASSLVRTHLVTIFQILICMIVSSQLINCSTSSQFQNKDFSNKPVNLNNEKERQKFEEISREVERNRSLWKEKNISNYDFEIENFAEGMGSDWTQTFKVRDNKTLPVKRKYDYPPPSRYENINSVEKLFDYIQQSLETGYSVSVTFNKEYGYPEDIGMLTGGNGWVSTKIKQLEIVK